METILFDIDLTLLNNPVWNDRRNAHMAQMLGVDYDTYVFHHESFKKSLPSMVDFSVLNLSRYVSERLHVDPAIIEKEYYDAEALCSSVFPDVLEFLQRNEQNKRFILGIYSAGYYDIQYGKLAGMGVAQYFDTQLIFISKEKHAREYLNMIPPGIIVDDEIKIVSAVMQAKHLSPVLIDRKKEHRDWEGIKIVSCMELFDDAIGHCQ